MEGRLGIQANVGLIRLRLSLSYVLPEPTRLSNEVVDVRCWLPHNGHFQRVRRMSAVVEGFGCRPIAAMRLALWPASESRQGKNPRGMGRGECRALRYGDLADTEGVGAGAPCPWRRLVTRLAGSHSSG